ncbi:MAG TPA: hypothetical protein VG222_19355 [Vicinamibacterales bacterium]|nr:hypothetical protein [Vicinamibacterales bacterium]
MRPDLLDLLRCPFCGGRLALVESGFVNRDGDEILDGILGCHCCAFPIVDGIPIMHLEPAAAAARAHLDAGRADLARRAMLGLEEHGDAPRFDEAAASPTATYRDIVDALGPHFEGGYFLYRFTDPTYLVSQAVVRAVAGTILVDGGRAIDVCGGSGHLTRTLLELSSPPPVLADLYFAKVWLGRRFTAPGCAGVCCDGNAPLPFARGAFRVAVCSDAYHYIWTKRLFASEMIRLTDAGEMRRAVVISHTHNANQWNPSAGMPLPPEAYRDLFEDLSPRLFGESALLGDIIEHGRLDLSRCEPPDALDRELALTIVASTDPDVFAAHTLDAPGAARGEFRINPLYAQTPAGDEVRLTLRFPSDDYEQEYGASRLYLPEDVTVARAALDGLPARIVPPALAELARQRVVIDLPRRYY